MDVIDLNQFFLLRMLERLIGVGIGGLAIYFGYRLFVLLPCEQDNRGKLSLPGVSVVLAKVGPGVFFAAFGALIVYQSFGQGIAVKSGDMEVSGAFGLTAPVPHLKKKSLGTGSEETAATIPTPDQLAQIRGAVQMLNCLQKRATRHDSGLRPDEVEEPIRLAKIALIESMWSPSTWGEVKGFKEWTIMGIGSIDPVVREIYEGQLAGCLP